MRSLQLRSEQLGDKREELPYNLDGEETQPVGRVGSLITLHAERRRTLDARLSLTHMPYRAEATSCAAPAMSHFAVHIACYKEGDRYRVMAARG